MSKYQHQTLHAPQGADLVTDPPSIPETRGRHIEGFFPARHGVLQPSYPLRPLVKNPPYPFPGYAIFLYKNPEPLTYAEIQAGKTTNDLLVFVTAQGFIYYMAVEYEKHTQSVRGLAPWALAHIGFNMDFMDTQPWPQWSHYSGVQVGPELFIAATAGASLYSFFIHPQYKIPMAVRVGLHPPPAPTLLLTAGGSLTASSYYEYRYTLEDPFGRESSPGPVSAINTGTSNKAVRVSMGAPPEQHHRWWDRLHIYRTLAGGGRFYRVHTYNRVDILTGFIYIDTAADTVIAENDLCPYDNQNDPPRPTTFVAAHKNRLWATIEGEYTGPTYQFWVRTPEQRASIQVSNLLKFSQFSRADQTAIDIAGESLAVTDGTELSIDVDTTDPVTGMISAGAALCVWKRYGMWLVWGDDPTTFSVQFAHKVGCVALRTVCNFKGQLTWRGPDGLYITNGASGFIPRLISKPIEPVFDKQYPWIRVAS